MRFNTLIILSIVLATGLAGCSTPRKNMALPVPRPLGHDIPVFRPPAIPEERLEKLPSLEEAGGEMTLRKAVALALLNNPELKAFSWAVRAREAGTLKPV